MVQLHVIATENVVVKCGEISIRIHSCRSGMNCLMIRKLIEESVLLNKLILK